MENITRKAERMVRGNAKRRNWKRFVAIPAALVVFITTYALILPAIAMEGDVYCGYEAHTHTDECYKSVLACGYESGEMVENTVQVTELACKAAAHQHTEACYDADGNVICGYADYLAHTHNADCYDANGALVCPLPQVEEHTHDESCYAAEIVNVCGLAESEGHIHSESCYTVMTHNELACGQVESAGHIHSEACYATHENTYLACGQAESEGHIHSEACYTTTVLEDGTEVTELTCGQAESAGHIHTDACYATELVTELVCGQAESAGHTHTEACYVPVQTVELTCGKEESAGHTHTDACWATEMRLVCTKPEVILHTHTDDCYTTTVLEDGTEVKELTCGQIELLGHTHSAECFNTYEQTTATPHQHTDVCYVMNLDCTLPEHVHTQECYQAPEAETEAEVAEVIEDAEAAETETAPEMVLICDQLMHEHTDACYAEAVCGIAEHTHDETCYDANGELVCTLPEHTHTADCAGVVMIEEEEVPEAFMPGLICGKEEHIHTAECMNENLEYICGKEAHEHTADCWQKAFMTKTYFDGNVTVTATYTAKANIPEEAYLKAYKVTAESDPARYAARVAQANAMLGNGQYADQLAIYNIGFYIDGVEIEPEDAVQVRIQFLDANGFVVDDTVSVVHFAESGTELIEASADSQGNAASFETGSFSDFLLSIGGGWGWIEEPSFEGQMDAQTTETGESSVLDFEVFSMSAEDNEPQMDAPAFIGNDEEYGILTIGGVTESSDLGDFLTAFDLTDSKGDPVESGGTLYVGDKYTLKLTFAEVPGERQMAKHVEYELPANFDVTDTDWRTETSNGITYRYKVGGGKLIVEFPNGDNGTTQELAIEVTLDTTLKKSGDSGSLDIPLGGGTDLHFDVDNNPRAELEKTNSKYNAADRTVEYTVELNCEHGVLDDWNIHDELGKDKTYGQVLKYPDPMTVTYTYDDGNGNTQTGTVEVDTHSGGSGVDYYFDLKASDIKDGKVPNPLPKGSKLTFTYKAELNPDAKSANGVPVLKPDGSVHDSDVKNTVYLTDDNGTDLKKQSDVSIDTDTLKKSGKSATVVVGGEDQDAIKWEVQFGDGSDYYFLGQQVTDKAGDSLHFVMEGEDAPVLKLIDPATGDEIGRYTPTFTVTKNSDGTETMTYTMPTEAQLRAALGDKYKEPFYIQARYYTTYTPPAAGEQRTYTNTVTTTLNGETTGSTSGSYTGVGPVGDATKKLVNDGSVDEDGYLEYEVTVPVPQGDVAYRFEDNLTLSKLGVSGSLYVENLPQDVQVYLGDQLLELKAKQCDKTNNYLLRTRKNYADTEINRFLLVFNTKKVSAWYNTTNIENDSHLHLSELTPPNRLRVTYKISLDAPVYLDKDGAALSTDPKTLREAIKDGYTVVNEHSSNIGSNTSKSKHEYTDGDVDTSIVKDGKILGEQKDGSIQVEYRVYVSGTSTDGGFAFSDREKIEGLLFTDTFSSNMEYVEDSLHVEVWKRDGKPEAAYQCSNPTVSGNSISATGAFFNKRIGKGILEETDPCYENDATRRSYWKNEKKGWGGWSHADDFSNKNDKSLAEGILHVHIGKDELAEQSYLVFVYRLKIKAEALESTDVSYLPLDNTAHYKYGDDQSGDSSCRLQYPTGQMTKTAALRKDGNDTINVADFVIEFNKAEANLLEDSDVIQLDDEMSPNLHVLPSTVKVYEMSPDGTKIERVIEPTTYTVTIDETGTESHKMTITGLPDGTYIRVEYSAEILTVPGGGNVDLWNNAKLWGKENYGAEVDDVFHVDHVAAKVTGDRGKIKLIKEDKESQEKLAGAQFALYVINDTNPRSDTIVGAPEKLGDKYFFKDIGQGWYLTTCTTGPDGTAQIEDQYLIRGWRFVLVEIEPPKGGYPPLDPEDPSAWTQFYYGGYPDGVTQEMGVPLILAENSITIPNESYNYELPETGGMGTMVYTLGGIAMLSLAGAIFCGRQRRRARSHR